MDAAAFGAMGLTAREFIERNVGDIKGCLDHRDFPEDWADSILHIAAAMAWVAAGRPTHRWVSKGEFDEMVRRELAVLWAQENARRARPRETWQQVAV
jgi:hypothetical protein